MDIWNDLGFTENPYSPRPIAGGEVGERLLVGRDNELKRLTGYITSSDTHPTLEGANGVGKTSLVAVAGYKLHQSWLEGDSQQAIIPLSESFQLSPETPIDQFKKRVLFRVAQAFIDNHDDLKSRGYNVPESKAIQSWLQSPILGGWSGGINAGGAGGSVGYTSIANTSEGFTEEGFVATVSKWLRDCFPTNSSGGFLCVVDNLELLETSKSARLLLEAARDEILGIDGLRWVLCGARGIVRSAASSPRLQGVLSDPQYIQAIKDQFIPSLVNVRIDVYSMPNAAIPPVEEDGFVHLFKVGNSNLRNAMKYSEDFAIWADVDDIRRSDSKNKFILLETWMSEVADEHLDAASAVGKRAWEVFDRLIELGGTTSPSDFADFGFNNSPAMSPHLRALEHANLIESEVDETDNRRRTVSVTSAGWIVNYSRSGYMDVGGA